MRIAIIGSRDITYAAMKQIRDYVKSLPRDSMIITGGWYDESGVIKPTRGADKAAVEGAIDGGFSPVIVAANPVIHGARAGVVRNQLIADLAQKGICFWNGVSSGSMDCLNKMKARGTDYEVIKVEAWTR